MPDIYVRNFMKCQTADVSFEGVALIGGVNKSGKSSFCRAVRAALTGEGLPLDGDGEKLTKKDSARLLVSDGAEKGSAMIRMNDAGATMTWPKCEYASEGARPPASSRIAAGLDSFIEMKTEERARFLVNLLGAKPTREEFLAEIAKAKIGKPVEGEEQMNAEEIALRRAEGVCEAMWAVIDRDGWETATKTGQNKGAEGKGMWREVTSEIWGAEKSIDWKPPGWNPKWDNLTADDLEPGIASIVAEIEAFDKKHGKAEGDLETTKAVADLLPQLEAKELPNTTELGERLTKAEETRRVLPESAEAAETVFPCPHCQEPLAHVPSESPPWRQPRKEALNAKQVAALRGQIEKANLVVNEAKNALARAHVEIANHERAVTTAKAATETLKTAKAPTGHEERQVLVDRLARGRTAADLVRRRIRAAEINIKIGEWNRLVDIMAADGLRKTKLTSLLGEFNEKLAKLSDWMRVGRITVEDSMAVVEAEESGHIEPYWRMSGSQKCRTEIVLQATIAAYDGSSMIVIDTDVDQDDDWIVGTVRMLGKLGIPTILSAHLNSPDLMIEGPPPGKGYEVKRYWAVMEASTIVPLETMLEEAA